MTNEGIKDELYRMLSDINGGYPKRSDAQKDRYREAVKEAIEALEKTRWIPVRERLPEKRGSYLVTQKATFPDYVYRSVVGYALNLHDVDEYDFADKKRSGWYEYDSEWGYRELDDVIAWMPLPTPFRAESEVQDDGE